MPLVHHFSLFLPLIPAVSSSQAGSSRWGGLRCLVACRGDQALTAQTYGYVAMNLCELGQVKALDSLFLPPLTLQLILEELNKPGNTCRTVSTEIPLAPKRQACIGRLASIGTVK